MVLSAFGFTAKKVRPTRIYLGTRVYSTRQKECQDIALTDYCIRAGGLAGKGVLALGNNPQCEQEVVVARASVRRSSLAEAYSSPEATGKVSPLDIVLGEFVVECASADAQ